MTIREKIFTMVCLVSFMFAWFVGKLLGYSLSCIGDPTKKSTHKIIADIKGGD